MPQRRFCKTLLLNVNQIVSELRVVDSPADALVDITIHFMVRHVRRDQERSFLARVEVMLVLELRFGHPGARVRLRRRALDRFCCSSECIRRRHSCIGQR